MDKANEINNQYFPITSVHRDDLSDKFDTSDVDDDTMRRLADKMADAYMESVFWTDLEILADALDIPRKEEKVNK